MTQLHDTPTHETLESRPNSKWRDCNSSKVRRDTIVVNMIVMSSTTYIYIVRCRTDADAMYIP